MRARLSISNPSSLNFGMLDPRGYPRVRTLDSPSADGKRVEEGAMMQDVRASIFVMYNLL